jgi:hypothetical protein
MAPRSGLYFDGATSLTDTHDIVQAQAGNATWVGEFLPVVEGLTKRIAEVLLWLFHSLGSCCAIVGESAMYIGGKLRSHPNFLPIYIAHHPQNLSTDIRILLQIGHTPAFSLDCLDFLFQHLYSTPGDIFYIVRYGEETIAIRIDCVDSLETYGPRSNHDFVQFMWTTFAFYSTNYAMLVLP